MVLLLNFHFPSLHAALANNRRPKPGPRASTERPAAHRVSSAELWKYLLEYFFDSFKNIMFICVCRHEDGTVRFWDASGVCLYPMYKLGTAGVFHTDADPNDNMNQGTEGEWPPFRKVSVCKLTIYRKVPFCLWINVKKVFINQTFVVATSHKTKVV